jgi:nucleoside-diphosphate-sugar epimerase
MQQISILGCGWLGLPLAKSLLEKGFLIKGSTTTVEKMIPLKEEKILPFLISLSEQKVEGGIEDFLSNSEILIVDIPPKLRGAHKENFVQKMANLIPFIEIAGIKKVLFVSSTSVYGESNLLVTEDTVPNPDTEGGKQLLEVERLLQSNSNFATTILRFGGLIGENRHPIKHLAGRQNIENGESPVNLIHQEDCIGIIKNIIGHPEFALGWNVTFNAVSPLHPTKKEYYTAKATQLGLPLPHFASSSDAARKIISPQKVQKVLHYEFNTALYS